MNERAKRMLERFRQSRWPICTMKIETFWDIWQQYGNKDPLVWRSKFHAAYLRRLPVFLEDEDMLCGAGASQLYGAEIEYEMGFWSREELELLTRENGRYCLDPNKLDRIVEIMDALAADERVQNMISYTAEVASQDERLFSFLKTGVVLPPWTDARRKTGGGVAGAANAGLNLGHLTPNMAPQYEKIMGLGVRAMIDQAKEQLSAHTYHGPLCVEKKLFWEGLIEILEAFIEYAHHHADNCERMAACCADSVRKAELLEMTRICRKVPEYPAETFREALQAFWLAYLMNMPPAPSGSRPDQLLYPYYQKDVAEGRITEKEALELLEVLRAKCMQVNFVGGSQSRKRNSGNARWMNFVMGGLTPEGEDATNDLTRLFFKAALETGTPHHTLTYRINEKTAISDMVEALRAVRAGLGLPAFVSDKNYMKFYTDRGFSEREAADYAIWGCLDGCLIGKTVSFTGKFVVVPMIMEIFLHNGICPRTGEQVGLTTGDVREMDTWEKFISAFRTQLHYLLGMAVEAANMELGYALNHAPNVYCSAMMEGGIEQGLDSLRRDFSPFNGPNQLSICGGIDAADALTAVKRLIFEEKRYTMAELMDALDRNWVDCEAMRQDFLSAPKYGSDCDEADAMVTELYQWFADGVTDFESLLGGTCLPAGVSISAHGPAGTYTGALPNGRLAGDCLSDGSVSPERGMDQKGFLAVLRSAMKIRQDQFNATLLNVKFHRSVMNTDEDLAKLAAAIKTYLCGNGKHIQINVVDQEELIDAQIDPGRHDDLVVRVAGYSAYFTALNRQIQDEVIERTGFGSI